MADEKTQQQATSAPTKLKKGAKKGFFEVGASFTSAKIVLYGNSADDFVGKIVNIDLTRILKGKNFELKAKVFKNEAGVLEAEPVSISLAGSYIRRMMRTGIDYVEDSFNAECKDKKVVAKPFMITRNKVSRAVRRELRNTAQKFLKDYFKARTAKEVLGEITSNKVQKDLFLKLKKIYPLSFCEIRVFDIVN